MIAMLYADDFGWIEEYSANVPQIVASYGGSYNFISTGPVDVIEGNLPVPSGVGIFEFPSTQAARQFLSAEEYKPYVELRNRHSRTDVLVFDGRPG
jgi:uncharacterized protein (DUF1330 family)